MIWFLCISIPELEAMRQVEQFCGAWLHLAWILMSMLCSHLWILWRSSGCRPRPCWCTTVRCSAPHRHLSHPAGRQHTAPAGKERKGDSNTNNSPGYLTQWEQHQLFSSGWLGSGHYSQLPIDGSEANMVGLVSLIETGPASFWNHPVHPHTLWFPLADSWIDVVPG